MTKTRRRAQRFACRLVGHDWFALAYPPARRQRCARCGIITEDAA